jgi:plasmid maintenance system antidote protein VapI
MAIRLSRAFGGSPESWLTQQMQYDLRQAEEEKDPDVERFAGA